MQIENRYMLRQSKSGRPYRGGGAACFDLLAVGWMTLHPCQGADSLHSEVLRTTHLMEHETVTSCWPL